MASLLLTSEQLLVLFMEDIVVVLFRSSSIDVSSSRRFVPSNPSNKAKTATDKEEARRKLNAKYTQLHLFAECSEKFLVDLWRAFKAPVETGFLSACLAYAPPSASQSETARKHRRAILSVLGQVYVRIVTRHRCYPLRHHRLEGTDDDAELQSLYQEWLGEDSCCKSNGVDEPLARYVQQFPQRIRHLVLKYSYTFWARTGCRCTILKEEHLHTIGQSRHVNFKNPASFPVIVGSFFCTRVRRVWEGMGFRDLKTAPSMIKVAYKKAKTVSKHTYAKPNYSASGRLSHINEKIEDHLAKLKFWNPLRRARQAELGLEFKNLDPVGQQYFKDKEDEGLRTKRLAALADAVDNFSSVRSSKDSLGTC